MRVYSCFIFATIVTMIVAEVPSYIKVCGRRNPNLDNCILDSVNALRDKLRSGIPSLQVPSIEPLLIEKGLPLTNSKELKAYATNVKLYNLHAFKVKNLHLDMEKKRVDIHVFFDTIRLTGDYNVTAKILVPLSGNGPIEIDTDSVDAKVILLYKFVKSKKGDRVFFTEMTTKLLIGGYKSKFIAREGPDDSFGEIINSIINSEQAEILQSLTPKLEKAVAARLLEFSNQICNHFTYDELFPDRE